MFPQSSFHPATIQWFTETLGEPTAERGGRRKKYFRIQPAGRRALAQALAALNRMTDGLSLEPGLATKPLRRDER